MFISKYGKTYDDADGSEQSDQRSRPSAGAGSQRGGQIGRERWEDDGGPANDSPVAAAATRPAWSVLSLHDLNESIRREQRADDPLRLRLEAERAQRRADDARHRREDELAAARRAIVDRYRNVWENT